MGSENIVTLSKIILRGTHICDIEWNNFNQWSVNCGSYWVGPTTQPLLIDACDVTKKHGLIE